MLKVEQTSGGKCGDVVSEKNKKYGIKSILIFLHFLPHFLPNLRRKKNLPKIWAWEKTIFPPKINPFNQTCTPPFTLLFSPLCTNNHTFLPKIEREAHTSVLGMQWKKMEIGRVVGTKRNCIRQWKIEKKTSFTHFTPKNTHISACISLYISKSATVIVHICTVTVTFYILF